MNQIELVQELRDACMCPTYSTDQFCVLCEAANEIERLRKLVSEHDEDDPFEATQAWPS